MANQDTARQTASILHPNVDPAALLVAVLAAGISPLVAEGAWNLINTVVAGVVLAVTLAYNWPRVTTLKFDDDNPVTADTRPDKWTVGAQALVYGFLFAIAIAWIVQAAGGYGHPGCGPELVRLERRACEADINDHAETASWIALILGAFAAVGFYFWIRGATQKVIDREVHRIALAVHVRSARPDPSPLNRCRRHRRQQRTRLRKLRQDRNREAPGERER